jgi:sensor domain CHASE-containing protein
MSSRNKFILRVLMFFAALAMATVLLSSCGTLTKTQRMERDMFDPKPTRAEKQIIKKEGVTMPHNKVKMPKKPKKRKK